MNRSKRIALAAAGVLGLAAPAIASMLGAPAWLIVAASIPLIAGAAALAAAFSEDKKDLAEQAPESGKNRKDLAEPATSRNDGKIPLTAENLEALMPGKAGLSQLDHEELDAIRREAHERMMERRRKKRTVHPRSAQEQRDRLLAYHPAPATDPARAEDHDAVPLTVFDRSGKNDPEKIRESLKELETVFGPPCPSRTFPDAPARPLKRLGAPAPFPVDPDIAEAAAERHRKKAETSPPDIAALHIRLAEEYEAQLPKKETE